MRLLRSLTVIIIASATLCSRYVSGEVLQANQVSDELGADCQLEQTDLITIVDCPESYTVYRTDEVLEAETLADIENYITEAKDGLTPVFRPSMESDYPGALIVNHAGTVWRYSVVDDEDDEDDEGDEGEEDEEEDEEDEDGEDGEDGEDDEDGGNIDQSLAF